MLSLVLIEPQACFAGPFARLLGAYAPEAEIRTFPSLAAAGTALRAADAVIVDAEPGRLDPLGVAAAVGACGGTASVVLAAEPASPVSEDAAGPALLGVVRKNQPSDALARQIIAAVRREARPGIIPPGWIDRRAPGGSLRFVGRDRRRRPAAV